MDEATERGESLKAGCIGAAATAIEFVAATGVLAWVHPTVVGELDRGMFFLMHPETLAQAAIAILSGALFGVTYRYVLRTDHNSHLQGGAIGAFGLVRGLAQIEASWVTAPYWLTSLKLLFSLLMFAAAALTLDWAMRQGWVKRFGA